MRALTVTQSLVTLATLAVAAWAVAVPLTTTIESSLLERTPEPAALLSSPEAPSPSLDASRAHALFGLPRDRPRAPQPVVLTPWAAQLLGTLEAKAPRPSAAALLLPNGKTVTVWEGESVLDAELTAIEHDAIWVRRGEHLERVSVRGHGLPAAPTPARENSVAQLSPTDFAVSRQAVMARMQNLYALSSSMRIVPAFREGTPIGFRFFATKPDAELLALGLKSGDVIRSINGQSLDSLDRVFGLANSLVASPSIDLQLERDGQLVTHHYRLD